MNFYEHQDVARRKTGRLIVLFILAVIAIIVSIYLVVAIVTMIGQTKAHVPAENIHLFRPGLLAGITVLTLLVVTLGSLWKIMELRGGGRVVAEMLGGRLLDPGETGLAERRLLNVVEEMAIASGIPVPPVYLLDEETGINAFAAGYSVENAVIGVTRGCLENLNRDQLQGVIAHEFSHILNGDMKLNIRLMGILNGILVIGLIGEAVLRSGAYSGAGRRRDKDGGGAQLMLIGLAIFIIGYVGFFFGKLIKAAVSRQREFLADASAVQFTRNPDGIAGALKKIGGIDSRSRVTSPHAEECSHMFFGDAKGISLFQALATHPPLAERIKRIDASFDGTLQRSDSDVADRDGAHMGFAGGSPGPTGRTARPATISPQQVTDSIGTIDPRTLNYAREMVAGLPSELRSAAREPYSARALVYALLLDPSPQIRALQLQQLASDAETGMHSAATALLPPLARAGRAAYLPLADLAMPALRQLSPDQYMQFRGNIEALINADDRVDLFEYALQHMLMRHLDRQFRQIPPTPTRYYSLTPFSDQIGIVLSVLARAGTDNEKEALRAFTAGVAHLGTAVDGRIGTLRPADIATLSAVDHFMPQLDQLSPRQKRQLVEAATVCIAVDGIIAIDEAELLRAIADGLSCPIPPLLAVA